MVVVGKECDSMLLVAVIVSGDVDWSQMFTLNGSGELSYDVNITLTH